MSIVKEISQSLSKPYNGNNSQFERFESEWDAEINAQPLEDGFVITAWQPGAFLDNEYYVRGIEMTEEDADTLRLLCLKHRHLRIRDTLFNMLGDPTSTAGRNRCFTWDLSHEKDM